MVNKDNCGPAFPIVGTHEQVLEIGMTLRDYFAAKAMQGLQANPVEDVLEMSYEEIAKYAYEQADAMLKARMKHVEQ